MSLQHAAQHIAQQGRGPDTTLVHMSDRELKSLSDLAQAHGGQLSINPHTGLPEAGFLDKLLPTIVGAGLTYFSGGAINPMTAGFITGGIETLRSGSLEKGLMAGLGAYGGAGLTEGLVGAGAGAIGMGARDAAVQSATQQGLTGEAYNKAIQDQVTQQMTEKATPFGSLSEGASQLFKDPGKVVDATGGGWKMAKYAAGAAAPYLADALKPNTEMPDPSSLEQPVEYRQYKVKRRPDLSYEYEALPVSKTFTPNFAEGGGVSEMLTPYIDPSFKFKNVGGPPKVSTATDMPELKLAEGGRITPEEFYQMYMGNGQPTQTMNDLKYGVRGYADTAPIAPGNPYEHPQVNPSDIVGVDGETYTWDAGQAKYVVKPKAAVDKTGKGTENKILDSTHSGGDPNAAAKQAAAFDAMTPAQKAAHAETMQSINEGLTNAAKALVALTPISTIANVLNVNKNIDANAEALAPISLMANKAKDAAQMVLSPLAILNNKLNPRKGDPAPVVDMSTMSDAAQAEANAAANNAKTATVTVGEGSAVDGDANTTSPSPGVVTPSVTSVSDGDGMMGPPAPAPASVSTGDGMMGPPAPASVGDGMMGPPAPASVGGGGGGNPGGIGIGATGVNGSAGTASVGTSAAMGGLAPHFTHHMATGGISDAAYNLGGYSDGGRLLRGPGDGVSDSIPATIGHKQPARLADGEFVVPARIVSEIGNGSTEAGARKLYAMMDRIQRARAQTVGKGKVAKNTRAEKYLPA